MRTTVVVEMIATASEFKTSNQTRWFLEPDDIAQVLAAMVVSKENFGGRNSRMTNPLLGVVVVVNQIEVVVEFWD